MGRTTRPVFPRSQAKLAALGFVRATGMAMRIAVALTKPPQVKIVLRMDVTPFMS